MNDEENQAQAVWFVAPRHAVLRPETVRPPAPGQVQVRAVHSLISAGSELNLYRGEGNLPGVLLPTAKGSIPFPVSFGYQIVGEVLAAGTGVYYAIGDKVLAMHPHQDIFNVMAAGLTWRIPPDVHPLQAQFARMFGVGLHTLLQRPIRPGEVVAVSGLGLIGTFAAYLARLSAGKLIVIDPVLFRRKTAEWLGADAVVTPEEASRAILELSNGRGVDLFIETSGAPPALQAAINNTAVLGTVAVAAWYGTRPVTLSLSPEFHLRSIKIVSIHGFNLDEDDRWPADRKVHTCFEYLKRIDVKRLISHRFAFAHAPDAYRLLDERSGETLAVLLEY